MVLLLQELMMMMMIFADSTATRWTTIVVSDGGWWKEEQHVLFSAFSFHSGELTHSLTHSIDRSTRPSVDRPTFLVDACLHADVSDDVQDSEGMIPEPPSIIFTCRVVHWYNGPLETRRRQRRRRRIGWRTEHSVSPYNIPTEITHPSFREVRRNNADDPRFRAILFKRYLREQSKDRSNLSCVLHTINSIEYGRSLSNTVYRFVCFDASTWPSGAS